MPRMASGKRPKTHVTGVGNGRRGVECAEEVHHDVSLERPTLTAAGSFKRVTGLGGTGPRDTVFNKQSL